MFNEQTMWDLSAINEDLLDINQALYEVKVQKTEEKFTPPPINYDDLEGFDSVSLSFNIPEDILSGLNVSVPSITAITIDELMDPALAAAGLQPNYKGNQTVGDNEVDFLDNVSLGCAISQEIHHASGFIQKADIMSMDLLDPARAHMDMGEIPEYQPSPLFNRDILDLEDYDTTSIKIVDVKLGATNTLIDWAEIEGSLGDIFFGQDLFETGPIQETRDRLSRSTISLVKGKGKSWSKKSNPSEQNTAGENSEKPFNVPMQLYIEDGELIFKVNLSFLDLRDLENLSHLSRGMNMKSVLSLLPRKTRVN